MFKTKINLILETFERVESTSKRKPRHRRLHSYDDKPSKVYEIAATGKVNGIVTVREWHDNGLMHRNDGPAFVRSDGYEEYWQHGHRHNAYGPAVIRPEGTVIFAVRGIEMLPDELEPICGSIATNKAPYFASAQDRLFFIDWAENVSDSELEQIGNRSRAKRVNVNWSKSRNRSR